MDYALGFLSDYISASELIGKDDVTLTIGSVTLEKVESLKQGDDEGQGKMKDRIVIRFKGTKSDRGWLLNKTNALCIVQMWGRETTAWIGKRITIYSTMVRVGSKMENGIRVKGSPDLAEPLTFSLKLPRKKPIPTTLVPTGKPQKDAPPVGHAYQHGGEAPQDYERIEE